MKTISNLFYNKRPEGFVKPFGSATNLFLAAILFYLALSLGLPGRGAQASAVTPAPPAALPASQSTCDSSRTVQVTGTAVVKVAPDRALIQLGVQSNGRTPGAAQAANSAAIQKVMRALQTQGVADKDIATDIYVIEPIYESYDSLTIKGYRINNLVAVTLREVTKTSDVIAAALEAGANQVVGVEFYTSELRKYRDQARELAVQAAGEKAKDLASAAGAETGCVLHITENTWSYYHGWWYGRSQGNNWTQNVVQNASPSSAAAPTGDEPISLGQISVKAEVGVTYGLQ